MSVDSAAEDLSARLLGAASECFAQSASTGGARLLSPWWSDECRAAVCARRRARRILERHPTRGNLIEYKKCSAASPYCLLQHKRAYKRKFLSSISYTTPIGVAWRRARLLRTRYVPPLYPLEFNGHLVDSTFAKANIFCRTFQHCCQVGQTRVPFNLHTVIVRSWSGNASYNCLFSKAELRNALRAVRMSSPGADSLHNAFFCALGEETSAELLSLFNQSFQLGVVPSAWKQAVVLPILKPGKDPSVPESYRPISLLSCLGKLMERLVAVRLEHLAEKLSLFSPSQCGFRKGLSTMDVLLRLEASIRAAQDASDICLVVYVDLKSAFDKVWIDGLLYKLARAGLCGTLMRWLHSYLTSRSARVRVNGIFSDALPILAGVPQGGVLSPLLYNLMLMDVPQLPGVDVFLYADDITICCSGSSVHVAKTLMQRYLTLFQSYCSTWGLVVNPNKSVFQYFTRKRVRVPVLRYHHVPLRYVRCHKLLGLVFDAPRLQWGPHISMLCTDVLRRIDLLKHLASPNWGANSSFLRQFYRSFIRAKIDYGSMVYRTASSSQLSKLDVLQNSCLRLVLGARRTSPVLSLQAEAHLPPLCIRRRYLAARFYIKLLHRPVGDPTVAKVCGSLTSVLCDGSHLLSLFSVGSCRRRCLSPVDVPPWSSVSSFISTGYDVGTGLMHSALFSAHLDRLYPGHCEVYCDGSRMGGELSTACGIFIPSSSRAVAWKLHPHTSILSAELFAILKALQWIQTTQQPRWVVCSDSLSALLLLQSPTGTCSDLVLAIRHLLYGLNFNRSVCLQWVKAHAGIWGNERADIVARLGHGLDRSARMLLPCSDILLSLGRGLLRYWETQWLSDLVGTGTGSHLASLRSNLSPVPWITCRSRRVSVVLSRFRLGHVGVGSYLFRFGMADTPTCVSCGVSETIEHFLLDCARYHPARQTLLATLHVLGVSPVTVRVLLGGGDYPVRLQHQIIRVTVAYLTQTGRLASL